MMRYKPFIYKHGYRLLTLYWFLFRPATCGVRCVIISGDHVLLIRHTYGSPLWTTVGGGIAAEETPKQAALRETYEEVGLTLRASCKKIGVVSHQQEYKQDTIHVFLGQAQDTTLCRDYGEIADAGWFPLDDLPADTSPLFYRFLELAQPHVS